MFGILGGSAASSVGAPELAELTRTVSVATAPDEVKPLTVLLMGDSYTAGNGARDGAGEPAYYGPERCMRSTNTWGEQYANIMEKNGYAVTLLNRACSAATTGAIMSDRYMKDSRVISYPEAEPAEAPLDDQFYIDWAAASPRCSPAPATEEYFVSTVSRVAQPDGSTAVSVACERWLLAQSAALNRDVDLVLITVGGNDVHFPDIARKCLIMANADGCKQAITTARAYARNGFAEDLFDVFEEINLKTQGHAKVGYAAYPGLEVNDDLRITSVGAPGVSGYTVSQELAALAHEGLDAQRMAAAQANEQFGEGFVTLMDGVPEMFRGHEPDARPGVANPDRWMYEFLETTERDEWYHLKPEGQKRIALYAATFGDFGASNDSAPARDVVLVFDGGGDSQSAAEAALAEPALWRGAQVAVVEQRVAEDGVHLERRVIAGPSDPADALAAVRAPATSPWLPAPSVQLQARWNASAQSVFIGDAALSMADQTQVWTGSRQGRSVSVDAREAGFPEQGQRQTIVREHLAAALQDLAKAPHAWAGGHYVTDGTETVLTAQGSFGPNDLTYAWDLNGDGVFETEAAGPQLRVDSGDVRPGWVGVRVAAPGGSASVASAWVETTPLAVKPSTPCITSDAGVSARSSSGRGGCRPDLAAPRGPDSEGILVSALPVVRIEGSADMEAPDAGGATSDEGRLLAALTVLPLYVDERVATSSGARVQRPTRRRDEGRARTQELVRREKGLRGLLAECGVSR
ncbi:MAG: hypothetical protein CVT68_05515 [Actinobacteria bacterium HGW-Actinobacteria-8]|nr:MAG: hypothetical protein CVT68_05515 [Actinobacteria bacterium HGW-Actinobacteria-8]